MSNVAPDPAAWGSEPSQPGHPARSKVLRLWIISCVILALLFAAGGLFVGCVVTAPPSPADASSPVD